MAFRIVSQFNKAPWSGGSTTELFIWPEESSFKSGQYAFRLSLAEIKDEYSVFTSLPGTQRTFMLLEGAVTLKHHKHHEKELKPFEKDQFEGGWHTEGRGTGRVLNLITKDIKSSDLRHCHIKKEERIILERPTENQIALVYLHCGSISLLANNHSFVLKSGQLAQYSQDSLLIEAKENSHLVLIQVNSSPIS